MPETAIAFSQINCHNLTSVFRFLIPIVEKRMTLIVVQIDENFMINAGMNGFPPLTIFTRSDQTTTQQEKSLMNRYRLFICVVMVQSGCGGGAGPTKPNSGSDGSVSAPRNLPEPEPEPKPCIQAKIETQPGSGSFICTDTDVYEKLNERFAGQHRRTEEFTRQWGLGAINADEAWAHVEQIHGRPRSTGQRRHRRRD